MLDDPRNNLVLEFVRLVAELDAKTFVFENVTGHPGWRVAALVFLGGGISSTLSTIGTTLSSVL